MRSRLVAVMAATIALGWPAAPALAHGGPPVGLDFLGQAIVPTGTMFQGTTIGGLSSITYDRARGVYYALSDDPSQFQPARFYTVAIDLRHGRLSDADVAFRGVTTLLAPGGQPYPAQGIDPEGLVLTCDRRLVLNLDDLGIPLDNVEGITVGPRLPDGRSSLVLVSDNNFAASQFTQFLLFAVGERHAGRR